MKVRALKPFILNDRIVEYGDFRDLHEQDVTTLGDRVTPVLAHTQDGNAWLTPKGEFRTRCSVTEFAGHIVQLTAGNLPLQKSLLLRHCESYDRHHLPHLWKLWEERAAIRQHDGGMSREEAELAAAEDLHLVAFFDNRPTAANNAPSR